MGYFIHKIRSREKIVRIRDFSTANDIFDTFSDHVFEYSVITERSTFFLHTQLGEWQKLMLGIETDRFHSFWVTF